MTMITRYINTLILCAVLLLSLSCDKGKALSTGNREKKPVDFELGVPICPVCNMNVFTLKHAVELINEQGETYLFDDVGCTILWIDEQKLDLEKAVIWIYAQDTKRWIDAKKARYSLIDNTPMRYGFAGYEHNRENFVPFQEMRLRMLRGLTLKDPKIRKNLLGK